MNSSLKQILSVAFGVLAGLMLGVIALTLFYITARQPQGEKIVLLPTASPQPMVIYITGAVVRPGVYALPPNSRMLDALNAAGGPTENADLSQINAAEMLEDGQQIEIPGSGEVATPVFTIGGNGLVATATPVLGAPININTADAVLLDTLPGIGPSTAQKIVEYRTQNGPFVSVEDLLKIPGIGPSTLEEIRPLVIVQ
ncbi:MAG: helix-hairpin-helix domain-containing protein [Anaerolineales bacterium]